MKVLFIGDVVGKAGRKILSKALPCFVKEHGISFVIANGENASHGKGLLEKHYDELLDAGVDCITLGNHYNSKHQIVNYIGEVHNLVRPINLLDNFPGVGSAYFEINGKGIRVTNVLGSAFINENVKSPYLAIKELIDETHDKAGTIHIIDFHAESTSEKQSFGYVFDGVVSAVLGTHTHVQTNDDHILPNGTAYISDVGMCGIKESVIGFEKESVIKKVFFGIPGKFELEESGEALFSAVVIDFDDETGLAKDIKKIAHVDVV